MNQTASFSSTHSSTSSSSSPAAALAANRVYSPPSAFTANKENLSRHSPSSAAISHQQQQQLHPRVISTTVSGANNNPDHVNRMDCSIVSRSGSGSVSSNDLLTTSSSNVASMASTEAKGLAFSSSSSSFSSSTSSSSLLPSSTNNINCANQSSNDNNRLHDIDNLNSAAPSRPSVVSHAPGSGVSPTSAPMPTGHRKYGIMNSAGGEDGVGADVATSSSSASLDAIGNGGNTLVASASTDPSAANLQQTLINKHRITYDSNFNESPVQGGGGGASSSASSPRTSCAGGPPTSPATSISVSVASVLNSGQLHGLPPLGCALHPDGKPSGIDCPKCDMILSAAAATAAARAGLSAASTAGMPMLQHSRNSCKTLKCPKCNWHYKYQETLEIHMKEKHPENDSTCVYCVTGQQHPKLARGEAYTCGYKPYRCDICNYSTTTKGNLSIHMQSDKHINNVQVSGEIW